nr:hypothetical protein [Cypionkella sp.]
MRQAQGHKLGQKLRGSGANAGRNKAETGRSETTKPMTQNTIRAFTTGIATRCRGGRAGLVQCDHFRPGLAADDKLRHRCRLRHCHAGHATRQAHNHQAEAKQKAKQGSRVSAHHGGTMVSFGSAYLDKDQMRYLFFRFHQFSA